MGSIDVSVKHSYALRPDDWAKFLRVPDGSRVRAVDSDVSSLATITDKVFEVDGPITLLLHFEPMAYYDKHLDVRMFEANARLAKRHRRPVHSCVFALHRRAWGKANQGRYYSESPLGNCVTNFSYQVIKVWELDPDDLLREGVGLLPLVPLTAIPKSQLRNAVDEMAMRFRQEVPRAIEADLWCATYVMLGLRFDETFASQILKNVRDIMRESATYQSIIEEGLERGFERGLERGIERGRGEGQVEGCRESILLTGTERFGEPSDRIQKKLTAIKDLQKLKTLLKRLLHVSSWQELLTSPSKGVSHDMN